jgi:ribosome-associated protein
MSDEIISKTKRKQEMHELQALGAALVLLPESQLRELSLHGPLHQAVLEARRIKSHEARRRQMQYIGRLMREVDAAPIRERLATVEGHSASATAQHRRLEAWRERLLADDAALTEFAVAFPGADLQALRALLRNARKELKEGKPPHAQREIFRFLRDAAAPTPAQG